MGTNLSAKLHGRRKPFKIDKHLRLSHGPKQAPVRSTHSRVETKIKRHSLTNAKRPKGTTALILSDNAAVKKKQCRLQQPKNTGAASSNNQPPGYQNWEHCAAKSAAEPNDSVKSTSTHTKTSQKMRGCLGVKSTSTSNQTTQHRAVKALEALTNKYFLA